AFPVGHCPSVALGGFLLNGGLGWNSSRWGPACFSIEAANVVTADGNLVVADDQQKTDLLWALRGAGPYFFGVVTQYRLKLYASPRAITTSAYFFPLQDIEEIGSWAGGIARQLPCDVELTLFIAPAPPDLAELCRLSNGFVCILNATTFVDTEREAIAALSLLERCPVAHRCLKKEVNRTDSIDSLLNLGGMLWPERHRSMADTLWSNSPSSQPLAVARDFFLRAPSPKSLAVCVFSTGDNPAVLPDAVFSMTAGTLLLCYSIWERPGDDAANAAWHREMIAALDPFAVGHYVGESDIVTQPARAERSFKRANWQRLQALRRIYDPDDRFHGHFSA
ncbi:MAG: FAD-binding oxidoreductase, partial [Nitrospiraceae bacterium]